jgi:phage tail-like protein
MNAGYFEGGYPPPAFYFTVTFGDGKKVPDASFSEVSGISIEMETEAIVEGGENRYIHQLPKSIKHPNLELKRGISTLDSPLVAWCKNTLEGDFIKAILPQTIIVKLNGADGQALRAWAFINAYPVKWDVEGFNATKNEVAIEKMTFAYTYAKRSK